MKSVVFDGCFGWLHPAAGRGGVVLCGPLGYEALCTHRAWKALAEQLASAGHPTLRFDYPGTGDSAGDDEEPERLRAWLDGIQAAVRRLRAETGVTEVTLVGLRTGATLAALAAEEMGGVDRLVLLAPWMSGQAYVHRLKALSRLNTSADGTPPPRREQGDDIEYGGFVLTAETQKALAAKDLMELRQSPARHVLLLTHGGARDIPPFSAALESLGATVSVHPFVGFVGLMRDALKSEIPADAFRLVTDWVTLRTTPKPVECFSEAQLELDSLVEQPIFFDESSRLFGIVSKPRVAAGDPRRPAVLFLNTGVNHHVGASRMSVTLARRLAAHGITSLRIDSGGIGDSAPRPGMPAVPENIEDFVCSTETCAEVTKAIEWLEARGHRKCVVVGLCSGATIGLNLALSDRRIGGLVLINIQRFDVASTIVAKKKFLGAIRSRIAFISNSSCPQTWQVALRAGIRFTNSVAINLKARSRKLRDRLSATEENGDTPIALMHRLSHKRVPTMLVCSENDSTRTMLEEHFGKDMALLRNLPGIRVEQIDGADHTLTLRSLREEFAQLMEDFLMTSEAQATAPAPEDAEEAQTGSVQGIWCAPPASG
ncbi:MAG TPA: alpha/beta hydrolase family protein [Azospirillum sp.]|nr:alpha/beta hydrolase family protein [Azospirillum sp.]